MKIPKAKKVQEEVTIQMAVEEIAAAAKADAPQEIVETTSEIEVIQPPSKPERNEKGQFLPGHTALGNPTGRACEFCERPMEILQKVNLYREWCRGNVDNETHIPYIEELVSEDYLDITYDQFEDWIKSENHKEQHKELVRIASKLFTRQKLALLKLTLKNESARGAIFQLSANHKVVEVSKQYQAGILNEPLEYNIHIVPKSQQEQIEDE